MFWVHYDRQQDAVESCAFVLNVYIQAQGVSEQIRTIATLDAARAEEAHRQGQVAAALLGILRRVDPDTAAAIEGLPAPRLPTGSGGVQ